MNAPEPIYTLSYREPVAGVSPLVLHTWQFPSLELARKARVRELRRRKLRGATTKQLDITHPCGKITR